MKRFFIAVAVAWVAFGPFVSASADATRRPEVAEIVRLFETVVFGSELDPKLASKSIAKWQSPVRLAIQGKPGDRHLEFLGRHAAALSDLTGLSIELVKPGEVANINVAFVPRSKMNKIQIGGVEQQLIERLAAPGGCFFISWQKPVGTIIGAVIVVNTERDLARINHCLLEELTQSLGMPNDTDVLRPSIFSDNDYLLDLARADVIVVRTLYDPRLKSGMPKAEALKLVPAIVGEINSRMR